MVGGGGGEGEGLEKFLLEMGRGGEGEEVVTGEICGGGGEGGEVADCVVVATFVEGFGEGLFEVGYCWGDGFVVWHFFLFSFSCLSVYFLVCFVSRYECDVNIW